MTTYPYVRAALNASAKKGTSPKDTYVDLFQETMNEQFYNSSDWWTVQEETILGSQTYHDVDVRIAHVINAETGLKLGDDWKTLMFQDVNHEIEIGKLYVFDDNTWVTINTEKIKNLTGTCTIRRCNNTMRWIDEATGAYYEEPCALEYLVKEPRDYITQGSPFPTPGGFMKATMQLNDRSKLIRQNQRFLFGNATHWTGYKVIGTGINDFRNEETSNNESANILVVDLLANFVNDELDDMVNGIADVNTNVYTIGLNMANASGSPTGTTQLTASITYNGKSASRTVTWESSDTRIATVSGSGLVTFVAVGACTITGTIKDNPAKDTCAITVSATPTVNAVVTISPDKNFILEGSQRTYSVYLYNNGVVQANTFTITCNGNSVPSTSYTFTVVDGNHFTIANILRDDSSYLTITMTSGTNTKTQNVYLKGAW